VAAGDTLAIVVVNFGSSALLSQNLEPLGTAMPDAQVVVVDNLSTADERGRIVQLGEAHGWSVVTPDDNTGFGGGMNLGVERAVQLGATHFLLLNPDASIAADDVVTMWERVQSHPLTMVAPRILRPDGSVWFDGADLYLDDGRIRSRRRRSEANGSNLEPWLSGACLLVSGRLWELVGGFAPEYFLYWEDVDLSHRVVVAGGAIEVAQDAAAIHAEGGTQGEGRAEAGTAKSQLYYYYNIRNRLLFAARNLPEETSRRWTRKSVPIAYEVLLQGGRRQFLRSLAPLGAAYRGIRDGRAIVRAEFGGSRRVGRSTPATGGSK
jgi:GT2 family glycosyltransferase